MPGIDAHPPVRRFARTDLGVVLWPSFLAACFASLLFFAAVDPLLLRDAGPAFLRHLDRESGYALGFLFFWLTSTIAGGLSVFLLRTSHAADRDSAPHGSS